MKKREWLAKSKIKILIAEDSKTQAERLRHLLAEHGFAVAVARDGAQALNLAREQTPTLILSDVLMPGMDGYTLCKQIKSDPKLNEVPVVLMTSLSSPQDVLKGLECGADNFFRKPVEEGHLMARINYILANRELRGRSKAEVTLEVHFAGKTHRITSERQQILDLLISTYEEAYLLGQELRRTQEEITHSNNLLKVLSHVAAELNRSLTEREVAERALSGIAALPEVLASWMMLRQGDGTFRVIAQGERGSAKLPETCAADCSCLQRVLTGELHETTIIRECEWFRKAGSPSAPLRSHLTVPLKCGERPLGVLNIALSGEALADTGGHETFSSVGRQIATALERAQLLHQLDVKVKERTAALEAEILERRRAEEKLQESEERYRFLFENNPRPMWIYDTETLGFLGVNDTAVDFYGYSREEFLGMKIPDLWFPEDAADSLGALSPDYGQAGRPVVHTHRKKDGTVIYVEITSHPLPFGKGNSRLAMINDVTERKKLEEQFLQAQKMEAVGQLAGGIAHDFNNLLTIILGFSEILEGRLTVEPQLQDYVKEIGNAAQRAAALTRQLLAFSRRQVLAPQVLDLNAVVANLEKMLCRLIGEDVELKTALAPDLGRVKADAGQIEQVIMNLAVNARDAMPEGGKLSIETADVELDNNYARTHSEIKPGPHVMLAVSDTGGGMDPETQTHIFEPFFTTKEQGKGTGLGLATVFGIVKQSGGTIFVYSEPGKGSTFKVYLPRVEDVLKAAGPARRAREELRGTETILLVEDEAAVRHLVRETLVARGYNVLEAHTPSHAAQMGEQHAQPIHLMLTDIVMPGMSGKQLADKVASLHPEMKVLFMSGYTDNAVVLHGVLEADTAFLQKPFTPEVLARKVREVLEARS